MDVEQFLDQPKLGCFVDGTFIIPADVQGRELVSPTTGKHFKWLAEADRKIAEQAIESSKKALIDWKQTPPPLRGKILRRIGELLDEYADDFAKILTLEMGKPIKESYGEVTYSSGYFYWFAGEAERIYGQTIPSQHKDKRLMIIHQPIGVCACITPWNFPIAMAARKIAPALAAGCTMIVKPSPESPISLLLLAHICKMAGLPDGVLNVIPGPEQEIGEALLSSPIIRKLSFTGSTQVGKYLYQQSADTLKKLTLELGGNAPTIVFDDADIEKAVKETINGKFRNTGQTCVSPNRIFVQEGIFDAFVDVFVKEVKKLKIGDPLDSKTDVSSVLHPASQEKVKKQIDDAFKKGARAVLKGSNPHDPTILVDVTPDMNLYKEETFGPMAPIFSFKSDEEAIKMANDTPFGLASYVFTKSLLRARYATEALEYGIVGLNDGVPSSPQASFGGIKYSGFGKEGGPGGIYEYLNEKFISAGE